MVYRAGAENSADYLSRHPLALSPEELDGAEEDMESLIRVLVEDACPTALTLAEVRAATEVDTCKQEVRETIRTRQWKWFLQSAESQGEAEKEIRACLWRCREELSEGLEGIILRGDKIVMPRSLWLRTVDLAHQGHQGVEKTKARIRTKVWFPGVDDLVEEKVRGCHACIIVGGDPPVPPVATEAAVDRPWAQVALDFGSFPDGRHTVVMVDSHSKFPLVEVVSSTAFETLKPVLDRVFALFGLPEVLRMDNGPPFQGAPFQEYLAGLGVVHRKVMPQWPQANGEVEKLMRTLYKALRNGVTRGEDLEECLQTFLWAYRNTPHCTTKCAPRDLLMPRARRDVIPASGVRKPQVIDQRAAQERRKRTNDKVSAWRKAKVVRFQPRDVVVVRNRRPGGKFGTQYEPDTWEVVCQ